MNASSDGGRDHDRGKWGAALKPGGASGDRCAEEVQEEMFENRKMLEMSVVTETKAKKVQTPSMERNLVNMDEEDVGSGVVPKSELSSDSMVEPEDGSETTNIEFKTKPTEGLVPSSSCRMMVQHHHHNTFYGGNHPLLSRRHETEALEKSREDDPPIPGVLAQDESRFLDLRNESTTMDLIPEAELKPGWISEAVYSADTHRNDHINKSDRRRSGEMGDDVRDETCSSERNLLQANLEEEKTRRIDAAKGGAVGQTDNVFHGQVISHIAATSPWKRDNVGTNVERCESETSSIIEDVVPVHYGNVVHVYPRDGEITDMLESTVSVHHDGQTSNILGDTVSVHHCVSHTQDILGDSVSVQGTNPELTGVSGFDTVHHSDPELSDVLQDNVPVYNCDSKIQDILGDIIPVKCLDSELSGVLRDNMLIHHCDSMKQDILGGRLPETSGDSGANLPQSVRNEKDPESTRHDLEDVVTEAVTVIATESPSDSDLQIPSYGPMASGREGTDSVSRGEPNELWVDARAFLEDDGCNLDKPEHWLSSCHFLSAPDNTKSSVYLPPLERWSSSDSWASALSDWIQSVSVIPEDSISTKTFTNCQSSTVIQPTTDEKPFSSSDVGPECRKLSDGTGIREDVRTHLDADVAPQDLPGHAQNKYLQQDATPWNVFRAARPLRECSRKSEGSNALTEGDSEEEGERNDGALNVLSYPTPDCVEDPTVHGESCHLTRQGTDSCPYSDTGATRKAAAPRDGESIMPLTPIAIGTSFLHFKEEREQSRKLSLAGITDELGPDHEPRTSESGSAEVPSDFSTNSGGVSSHTCGLTFLADDRFMMCEEKRVAYVTLDLEDVLSFRKDASYRAKHKKDGEMPHKAQKMSFKNKDKSSQSQTKKQENMKPNSSVESSKEGEVAVIETIIITEKVAPRTHSKKKKKQVGAKPKENEPLLQVENRTKPKNAKSEVTPTPTPTPTPMPMPTPTPTPKPAKAHQETLSNEPEMVKESKTLRNQEPQSACPPSSLDDDLPKLRRTAGERAGSIPVRTRPQLPAIFRQKKEEDVKHTVQPPAEAPRVMSEIEAAPVAEDPRSVSLWCRFSPVVADSSVTWLKEGKVLTEEKKRAGDDARISMLVLKASSKDLGFYRCSLLSSFGLASTSDYHLTSEVLMELIIPDHDAPAERREVDGDAEDVTCAPLLFKDSILTEQYFGEQQHTSIVTEKSHFGEGMHRKAFRTTVRASFAPSFSAGHACVLKVHNSIGYGTNSNEELVQKNYNLAVEECYVQNTAREYIKAYNKVAKSAETFGEVPEIIPIFLVHRPSNAVPYATLEEELIGDFVKYSVKDGKEINLMRRDSEAGQKCCTFQHWVYTQTEGNLLVTDMQGVGMKLTDVGIATCKKGYNGFKGNCSTTFIDQFKALHQCNRFCELLGLNSLQPKPKRTAPPKPKAPPSAKKKPFSPTLKGKS